MSLISMSWWLDGAILTLAACIGIYLYMTRKFGYWKKRGVMEIPPTPFIGNVCDLLMLKRQAGLFLKDLYDGSPNLPYMGFYSVDKPFFLVRDPQLIKSILVRDFNYFGDRFANVSPDDVHGNANLFILKNPGWRLVRSKLTSFFTSGKLKKMFELMREIGEDLGNHLDKLDLAGEGRTIEVKDLCAKYTTDIIGTTAFGLKTNSLNDPDASFRKHGRDIFAPTNWRVYEMLALFFAPQFMKILGFKFWPKNSGEFLSNVLWGTIVEREKSGIKRNDLIDLLVELKNDNAGSSQDKIFDFDGDNLVAQAGVFFTAGFETTSTAISFTLYELALAPQVQTKLRNEIKDGLEENDGKITYDMVMSLPYLDMVVSETLRKYPSLSFLDRVVAADYKVPNSDIVLEKGTPVFIPMLGLHYDSEIFPNPDFYDPERFSEENKKTIKPFTYFPFGEGPRACIGLRLGQLQVKLGLVNFLLDYEISPCKETLIPMKFNPKSLLVGSIGGLYLNMRKIT